MTRTVLVTGGNRGIGLAIARRFVADGDAVTVTGRDQAKLADVSAELGVKAIAIDNSEPDAIESLGDEFADGIDVIVNNAGAFVGSPPGADAGLRAHADYWTANLQANLIGAVLTVQVLEGPLRPGGSVISIGSIGAEYGANPYSAAKAALAAWNGGLAKRLGEREVTANVISPGYIEDTDLFGAGMTEERRAWLVGQTFVKRAGQPDDIAATAHFLASPGARHITGQCIHVNGGAHTTR